jgi:hypothetical protein
MDASASSAGGTMAMTVLPGMGGAPAIPGFGGGAIPGISAPRTAIGGIPRSAIPGLSHSAPISIPTAAAAAAAAAAADAGAGAQPASSQLQQTQQAQQAQQSAGPLGPGGLGMGGPPAGAGPARAVAGGFRGRGAMAEAKFPSQAGPHDPIKLPGQVCLGAWPWLLAWRRRPFRISRLTGSWPPGPHARSSRFAGTHTHAHTHTYTHMSPPPPPPPFLTHTHAHVTPAPTPLPPRRA